MVQRSRVWMLPALACVAAALALVPPAAAARSGPDDLTLDAPTRGQRALDALGDELGPAAAANGLTARGLRQLLLADKTAWLDTTGRVLFKEPLPSGTVAAEQLEPPQQVVADAFALHSKPGSRHVIFLDFDGSYVSGTAWNQTYGIAAGNHPAWTLDADSATFNTAERAAIASIWARVAEDFAPFDVDVTTQDPGSAAIDRTGATDSTYGTRVLISPSTAASSAICNSNCGGVAYLDVFDVAGADHAYYQPAWIFPQSLGNSTKSIAEAATHEAGHNFGLSHDATATSAYYSGQAMWAPIMGVGYTRPVVQWSKGEYAGASNTQDDLAIIAANGAPLIADEAGGSVAAAAPALPSGSAFVTTRTDQDFYALGSCTGALSLVATPAATSPDLDIQLALVAANGSVVASADPVSATSSQDVASGMSATLAPSVTAGSYFLRVDGVGSGTALTGYSDYASIGAYTLSVSGACDRTTADPAPDPTPPPVAPPAEPQQPVIAAPTAVAPGAPRISSVVSGSRGGRTTAKASWSPPSTDGGSPVTGYRVLAQRLNDKGAVVKTVASSWLSPGARSVKLRLREGRYRFVVVARNAVGVSKSSARSKVVRAR